MIGERLKKIRYYYGDTQSDLARKLNVSKFTVQSWEQGKSEPNHNMLVSLCLLYEVSSDFLLGITDEDPTFYHNLMKQKPNKNNRQQSRFRGSEYSDPENSP